MNNWNKIFSCILLMVPLWIAISFWFAFHSDGRIAMVLSLPPTIISLVWEVFFPKPKLRWLLYVFVFIGWVVFVIIAMLLTFMSGAGGVSHYPAMREFNTPQITVTYRDAVTKTAISGVSVRVHWIAGKSLHGTTSIKDLHITSDIEGKLVIPAARITSEYEFLWLFISAEHPGYKPLYSTELQPRDVPNSKSSSRERQTMPDGSITLILCMHPNS